MSNAPNVETVCTRSQTMVDVSLALNFLRGVLSAITMDRAAISATVVGTREQASQSHKSRTTAEAATDGTSHATTATQTAASIAILASGHSELAA